MPVPKCLPLPACSSPPSRPLALTARDSGTWWRCRPWQRTVGTEVGPLGAGATGRDHTLSGEASGLTVTELDGQAARPTLHELLSPSGPSEADEVAQAPMWVLYGWLQQALGDDRGQSSP